MTPEVIQIGIMLGVQFVAIVAFLIGMKKDIGYGNDKIDKVEKRVEKIESQQHEFASLHTQMTYVLERLGNLERKVQQ